MYKIVMGKISINEAMSSIGNDAGGSLTYRESIRALSDVLLPRENINDYKEWQKRLIEENEDYSNGKNCGKFTYSELMMDISKMKNKKAPGDDGLSNEIVREAVKLDPELFLFVFNACLREGVFPSIWKKGIVKFLLKGIDKERSNPRSYRPISLLPVIGKLLERLIVYKLFEWRDCLYSEFQYGFRKRRSTVDAIRVTMNYVQDANEKYVVAMLFDVEGAFDGLWWPSLFKR